MSADWYAYKTKAGETLFFYNTKTREHRWAKKCNRLQFELIKNEYDDHNKNCATSNGMRAENSPSVWRPYNSVKSGKTLFYYNIITGEHKWGLNPDELNSSIPSEPISLRDDFIMDATSVRNEDQNGNTINMALGDPIEVKKENDHDVIDEETQDVTENEPEIQQTSTAEKQSEKQFLEELNSIEPNSGFMALRSTVKKRNVSYVDSSQTTLQQNSYSEEYLSDGISSSDDDDCSNFSDELPDISTSESEEEDEEDDERARKNRRRSKYDLQNLNAKNSRIRKSVLVSLNDDGLSHDRIREENQGQQACVRQLTSTHENIPRMNGIPTIQDITNGNLNRALFHRHELEARSTSNDSMPTIACAFSIVNSNDSALEKVGFEKSQNSIDSTGLGIYQPDSKFRCETSERSGNVSAVAQINANLQRKDLNPNLEKDSGEHARSNTKEGKIDTQSIPSNNDDNMPTIGEVFSLPENTAKLEVAKLNFEKASRSLENTISSIYQPNSSFGYEASPAVCNNSVELQKPDDLSNLTSDGRQEAQNSYIGTSAFDEGNHFPTPSLQMTQSVEERLDNEADYHLSKPTTGEDSENKLLSKDTEDVSSGKDALENENLLAQSEDFSESFSYDFVEGNLTSSSIEGSTLELEPVVSDRGFEQEEEGYATMPFEPHDSVSNHSLEMHVKEQEKANDTVEGSQRSQQASNQDHNHEIFSKGVVESDVSDTKFPASPERDSAVAKTTTSNQEEQTNLNNVNYRYHYSIKCLLPMIGTVPTHADTGNIRCDNLRPTMILSSRFLGVLPNSNSLTASNTSRPDRTEPLSFMTADVDKDDQLAPVIAGIQNDPRTSVNRSERNDSSPNQEERTNCTGLDRGQLLSQQLDNKSCLPQGASFMASENALGRNIMTTFENHVSYRRDTLTFSDAGIFNGLPYILENLYARYKCCYCGKDFRIQEELKRHLALRHLLFGGVFLCNSCDDSFISQEEFAKHLLLHDEVKPVKCRHCKEEFVTVEELACHLSTHADDPKYPQYEKRRKVEKGSTTETLDQDSAENDLRDEDKPEKRLNCSYCDKSFKHYFAFRLHLKTHSQVDDFKCLLCGKWYLDLTSLRKHVVIHLREKRLECGICHKTFRFHSDYLQHQLVHVKGQLFRCESRGCKEVFKTWDELRQHEIAMHEERRYRCTQCGKSFSRQEKLQNHILLHTGEKPLECEKCGRRFRIRRILRNHEKIHLEAKTFKCPVCGKGFKQKCSMLRHAKTHNSCPKEYQCNLCKKRFTQSCSLQRHLRIHSGERFKCPKCSMTFLEAWRMRVHIAKKHSEE